MLSNKRPGLFPYRILVEKHDIDLLEGIYATAITNYAITYHKQDSQELL